MSVGVTAEPLAVENAHVRNGLSIDVEEWFHILNLPSSPPASSWADLPATVEPNTHRLLEILAERDARGTFFVLGWVAHHYPALVTAIADAGHEIACHGDMHELCYEQGERAFEEDLRRSRERLEDLTGNAVLGYRAPGFSILRETPWAFEVIRRVGFRYDSSIFPAPRNHGGIPDAPLHPYAISLESGGTLAEFPMTIAELGPLRVAFAGGGYLRLFPYALVRGGIRRVNGSGHPACVYVHPREIDPDHPRIEMGLGRRFRSYVNLKSTEPKLRRLLQDFEFAPLVEILGERGLIPAGLS
jgi:polysaccharide deacetylase family protein (PEP-CTERM system associated)